MIRNVGFVSLSIDNSYPGSDLNPDRQTQSARALALLRERGLTRLSEFLVHDITAATVSRLREKGLIDRIGRGLYQLPDAELDAHHSLAEAAKLVPKGVICLVSALAFHELTDTMPARVWMAIGAKDRKPRIATLPIEFVRFNEGTRYAGIEDHRIEGALVRVYSPAKTVVDLFRYRQRQGLRYRNRPGLNIALEGLREALRQRKATPAEIARQSEEAGIWRIVQPYLEAMTANG